MSTDAQIVDPVVLIRIPKAYRHGMSDIALYEATRGVWKIGPRRDKARYALAVYGSVVQEAYEIDYWQPACTTPYKTRKFDNVKASSRWEFVGRVAPASVRVRYVGRSVGCHFAPGAQNPITYVHVPL